MILIKDWQMLLSIVVVTSLRLFLKYLKTGSVNAWVNLRSFFSIVWRTLMFGGIL